jgi:large subunit ribosomal protein L23
MLSVFRRSYATIPHHAAVARTSSAPRAVRLRRQKKRRVPLGPLQHDATEEGLTPSELARYKRLLASGELADRDGVEPSKEEWLDALNSKRSRIRGVRPVNKVDGRTEWKVVGQKVYLPNVLFRMVPNHTLEGQPYNPYEATFRIPQSITKTDIRSYLANIYGVKSTYIRTDNYFSPLFKAHSGTAAKTKTRAHRTYKRAVVGLVEPFYFPMQLEDMPQKEREERQKFIEERYGIEEMKEAMKMSMLRMTKRSSSMKAWKWRGEASTRRGTILKMVANRRAEREGALSEVKAGMLDARARGEPIIPEPPRRIEAPANLPAETP